MKRFIQPVILLAGIAAMVYGISKMSAETSSMILPVWISVGIISLFVTGVSLGIGALVKLLLHAKWHSLTFTSVIIIILVGLYGVIEYKPKLKIVVLSGFSGEVKLIVSKDDREKNKIVLDSLGVGYITRKDFEDGFYPKIIKGNADITEEIKAYSKGSIATSSSLSYSLDYLSFVIPGPANPLASDVYELIRIGAIDTLRLPGVKL